jgi:hypothetical protein
MANRRRKIHDDARRDKRRSESLRQLVGLHGGAALRKSNFFQEDAETRHHETKAMTARPVRTHARNVRSSAR